MFALYMTTQYNPEESFIGSFASFEEARAEMYDQIEQDGSLGYNEITGLIYYHIVDIDNTVLARS